MNSESSTGPPKSTHIPASQCLISFGCRSAVMNDQKHWISDAYWQMFMALAKFETKKSLKVLGAAKACTEQWF